MRYLVRIARVSMLVVVCLVGSLVRADAATSPVLAPTSGWEITVYYTAVERFHSGPPVPVTGCPIQDCERGTTPLGRYPADFVQAVQDEGTGRITSGPHAGRYLNWSEGTGYWLDTLPADARGQRLLPWRSAAVDGVVAPFGASVRVLGCGTDSQSTEAIDPRVCAQLRRASWVIRDRFTSGLGGPRHVDLYIGEEDRRGFAASSPKVIDTSTARVLLRR